MCLSTDQCQSEILWSLWFRTYNDTYFLRHFFINSTYRQTSNMRYTTSVRFLRRPEARGRQLYCWACNFKNVLALLAGNFYTSYIDLNRLPLLSDTGATRFYSKDIHLVMIQTSTSERWQNCINRTRDVKTVSTELEMSKLYQLFPQRK